MEGIPTWASVEEAISVLVVIALLGSLTEVGV